jgi:hypothetical protein
MNTIKRTSIYWQQEKEYKEALESFNEKNKEKAQLVTTMMEVNPKFFLFL